MSSANERRRGEERWIVIPRNVVARTVDGEPVELPDLIPESATEWISEVVARRYSAFCYEASGTRCAVLLPFDADYVKVQQDLAFILDRSVTIRLTDRARIDRLLDVTYLTPTGQPEVTECGWRFRTQCPLHWRELRPTETAAIRYCDTCSQPLYLCADDEEARLRAVAGQCVAVERLEDRSSERLLGLLE